MLDVIALALFILVLAFVWNGIINTAEDKKLRRFWTLLGFSEFILAFICYAALPALLYLTEVGSLVVTIVFSVLSMGAILTACLYPNRE